MKAKITKIDYVKEYGEGYNKLHYYNVWLEGQGEKSWNIGTKKKDPDFLAVGKVLEYEYKDEEKRKIKRVSNAAMSNSTKVPNVTKAAALPADPNSPSLVRHLDNFNESDLLFIDIETVRSVKELQKDTPLYDAWEYKTRYNNELERKSGETVTLEDYFIEKAALYAPFAKVVAIVVGRIVDGDKLSVKRYHVSKETKWDEGVMLREFNDDINKFLTLNPKTIFVGWANVGFDGPFLAKRMYVNRIKPNLLLDTAHLKPWDVAAIDLKNIWQGTAFYPDSMISAAVALGLPSPKSKMDGSQVGEAYYAGKINDIVEYCTGDVLTAANIFRVLKGTNLLTLK